MKGHSIISHTHFIKRMLPREYCTYNLGTAEPHPIHRGATATSLLPPSGILDPAIAPEMEREKVGREELNILRRFEFS
jgi:hypothetical protein